MGNGTSNKKGAPAPAPVPVDPVLGAKGQPMSPEDAASGTNPNYGNGREWGLNCQRCVIAYEMRRRGYDVEAQARKMNGTDTVAENWDNLMTGMRGNYTPVTGRNQPQKMANQMASYGDGARAVVYVKWKGRNSAHVFIAEQIDGVTHFIDPQAGKTIDVDHYMSMASPKYTRMYRVDNLEPNQFLIGGVVKKRN